MCGLTSWQLHVQLPHRELFIEKHRCRKWGAYDKRLLNTILSTIRNSLPKISYRNLIISSAAISASSRRGDRKKTSLCIFRDDRLYDCIARCFSIIRWRAWGEGRPNIFGHRNEFSRDHLYGDIFFSLFMFLLRNIKKNKKRKNNISSR